MANKKISELTAYTAPISGDVLPINDTATTTTKKITVDNLFNILSSLFRLKDSSDTTKKVAFDLSGITTGTTRTVTIPDATSTMVNTSSTQTMTNKTLTAPVITSPVLTVGSDSTGDIYYRSAGGFTRLAIGTANYILRVTGGVPVWSAETALADASTTVKGVVEVATAAEITAGTATGATGAVLAVSPDNLASSSPTFSGANITNITRLLNTITTDVSFSSSTAENTLLSYSVAGGTLSTSNAIRVTMHVSTLGVTNGNTWTLRFKYGATTLVTKVYTCTNSNTVMQGKMEFILAASGATGTQNGSYALSLAQTNFIANTYSLTTELLGESAQGTSAEDSTASKTLAITSQHSNNGASDNITVSLAITEVLR